MIFPASPTFNHTPALIPGQRIIDTWSETGFDEISYAKF